MCAIVGALICDVQTWGEVQETERILYHILKQSQARGRDGFGWQTNAKSDISGAGNEWNMWATAGKYQMDMEDLPYLSDLAPIRAMTFISNLRAEPTTEFVREKLQHDQQPYQVGEWCIVHNGTIANDKELRTHEHPTSIDSAAIVEHLNSGSPDMFEDLASRCHKFLSTVRDLVGSYAILATHCEHPDAMFVAANYRPVWYSKSDYGVFFASSAEYFPDDMVPEMLEPYSSALFAYSAGELIMLPFSLRQANEERRPRALVVASGGLDSTVAAVDCIHKGMEVELLHFTYGCRAEDHEVLAVGNIANALNVDLTVFPMDIYNPSDSRLFDKGNVIAGGEEGAEYAHEWVPARNLVMLSLATAIAEARGFDYIVLGNNLEEAGAYPDNEPEFIRKFNQLLPFAVGDGKRVQVLMPVGDLMKHEIVKLGVEIGTPLDKTWSCYKHDLYHCGKCGPCFMRKTAFEINGFDEVIQYGE